MRLTKIPIAPGSLLASLRPPLTLPGLLQSSPSLSGMIAQFFESVGAPGLHTTISVAGSTSTVKQAFLHLDDFYPLY